MTYDWAEGNHPTLYLVLLISKNKVSSELVYQENNHIWFFAKITVTNENINLLVPLLQSEVEILQNVQ
jgi:hypothetical protein